MSLVKYKQKRNFKESPEPVGGRPDSEKLCFVIQKHDASHLHYDFRLEMEGVLKSWAVPKGPSTDPSVKRLAMMVEDHPFDYRSFEGIIPSGYGAGTVIVWDEGSYEPADPVGDKKAQDKWLRSGLKAGKLHFILHGKKLKGEFALIKTAARGENAWLLFKLKDKYASTDDITLKEKSVTSGKTIAQVERTSTRFYDSGQSDDSRLANKKDAPVKKGERVKVTSASSNGNGNGKTATRHAKKKTAVKKSSSPASKKKVPEDPAMILAATAPKAKFSKTLRPMLATLVDEPFDAEGWLYEVKWDGYRALAFINNGEVDLKSRNDKSFNDKFYPVWEALHKWKVNAILDGEIVVVNEKGISDFGALQNWRSEADGQLLFYLFDILWLQGHDLTGLPLADRRKILESLSPGNDIIRISSAFRENGLRFFETARQMGLEGIIAKKEESAYHPGIRTKEWLKIKASKRQEMVIGGYTVNEDTGKLFSSLLLGYYDKGDLVYAGKVGTGFNDAVQKEMMKLFKKIVVKKTPFSMAPDVNKASRFRPNPPRASVTWLRPELVCEVNYTEITTDGILRHPSFQGLRSDKDASEVTLEKEAITETTIRKNSSGNKKIIMPALKTERKTLLNPKEETQVKKINGHELRFTNLSKIFWPDEKITKRDLINYYYQVAPFILPYLKDRPQSMNRHPNGITGQHFFYKDVTGKAPDWVETYLYHSPADNRDRNYLVAKDEASLLYMASLGCIEMNPWHSRVQSEDYPDWCIIDLDPGKSTFEQVIKAAQVTKKVLDEMKVPSYPKTSGSTGIHIYIPLGAKYTYDQSKEFARVVARLVNREIPDFTSIERVVEKRHGKMYIDFLQNRPQATVSAPYSVRPKPGATVSMPLHWDEVKKGLKMKDFTIKNAVERIRSEGDIFKPVLGKGISLEKLTGLE